MMQNKTLLDWVCRLGPGFELSILVGSELLYG